MVVSPVSVVLDLLSWYPLVVLGFDYALVIYLTSLFNVHYVIY